MSFASLIQLITLAAIWGGSFIFMRIAATPIGPVALIEGRVLFAAITLLFISWIMKKKLPLRHNTRHFFILGLFNTALPFLLFAYAVQTLNASSLAIINATAPIWGTLIATVVYKNKLTVQVLIGLMLGVIGVMLLVGWEAMNIGKDAILPVIAAVFAAFSYGIATNYAKTAPKVDAYANAHGSMWAAVIIVLPLLLFFPLRESPSSDIGISVLLLGVVCTGLAYLLYFRLVADIGPASTLSVTFLIPIFGILWGNLFLGEQIGFNTLFGSILVITGTMFVTGFTPKVLLKRRVA
jgi:drug/metabolite transporter (DMT)-like permease